MGLLTDEDLPGLRGLLQASGHVYRVARHEGLATRRVTCHHLTGVDPGPNVETGTPLAVELVVQRCKDLSHLRRGPDGSEGIVLVDYRDPEDGHHSVADELLNRSPMVLHGGAHLIEVPGHDASEGLRVQALA